MAAGKYFCDHPFKDVLLIEGEFVSEFLFAMPPMFVKVYMYLVYLCNHDELKIDTQGDIAQAVGLTEEEVSSALTYLNEKHLITYIPRPFAFEVLSAAVAAKTVNAYTADALTAYADYFAGIRALFPGRDISSSEYDKARDWVELYGLSVEASLLLIAHCIEQKDISISFAYMDKVALSWANDGIINAEAAEEYLSLFHAKHHEAAKLLQHLGLRRTPTFDEIKLYTHWSNDFGFDLKAIKAACSETTKTMTPSFAYIGRILERLHENGILTEKQIKAYLSEENSERRLAAVILAELGERSRAVSEAHIEALRPFIADGVKQETLISVAHITSENGMHTFTKYIQKLEEIKTQNAFEHPEKAFERSSAQKSDKPENKSGFKGRSDSYGNGVFSVPDANDI